MKQFNRFLIVLGRAVACVLLWGAQSAIAQSPGTVTFYKSDFTLAHQVQLERAKIRYPAIQIVDTEAILLSIPKSKRLKIDNESRHAVIRKVKGTNVHYEAKNIQLRIDPRNGRIDFSQVLLDLRADPNESRVVLRDKYRNRHVFHQFKFVFKQTQRYRDHLAADRYIRDFTLADYGEEGGFHGLPGITTDRMLMEKGYDGVQDQLGLVLTENREIIGAKDIPWSRSHKGKVVMFSCGMCHYSKAAGILIPGLGNKNVSPAALAEASLETYKSSKYRQAKWMRRLLMSRKNKRTEDLGEESAMRVTRALVSPSYHNLSQGLTSVNQTPLRIYRDLGIKPPADYPRAPSKAQAMWGLGVKRAHGGQFAEAGADGNSPGWAAGYDMGSEMPAEVMLAKTDKLHSIQNAFGKLLAPKYPFKIHPQMAARGETLFKQNCAGCHAAGGPYERDSNGYSVFYPPKLIPVEVIGTEPERAHLFDGLERLLAQHPLRSILALTPESQRPFHGYYSPRLDGIWSRFPYLHNGSVPSLMAMLTEPEKRPKVFSLKRAGEYHRFDQTNVGLTLPKTQRDWNKLKARAATGAQDVYDITRDEHSNQGHRKGLHLSHAEKLDLIEFLKTL